MLWSEILRRIEDSIILTQRFLVAGKEKSDSLTEKKSFPSTNSNWNFLHDTKNGLHGKQYL